MRALPSLLARVLAAVGLVALASPLAGCAEHFMPPTPIPQHTRARLVLQKEFRLGAFDFHSSSGTGNSNAQAAGDANVQIKGLEAAIPAMLVSELHSAGRFAVYEGGNIRTGGPLDERSAHEYVDAYLSGTITSIAKEQVCFDVRLANAVSHEVLFTRTTCTPLALQERSMAPNREAVKRLADDIARAIPKLGYAKVTSADGRQVFIAKGRKEGVLRGMSAYVVSTGETMKDTAVHALVAGYAGVDPASIAKTPVSVGELYILSVEDAYSVGLLYKGDYALPADTVFFK